MIPALREQFNQYFTIEKYQEYLAELNSRHPGAILFRIAETPIFIPKEFTEKMIDACDAVIDFITRPDFKSLTEASIPKEYKVPGENDHPEFLVFDFGICENNDGELEPQMIEMQGFPSLFGFEIMHPQILQKHFDISENFDHYLNAYDSSKYIDLFKKIVIGNWQPENVILLEINPHEQKTRIDFYCTQDYLGIPIVSLTDLEVDDAIEGNSGKRKLFYRNENGEKIQVKRIYNRIIFDELSQVKDSLGEIVDITQPLDVEWAPHPNWFYRISKYTLPFIRHPFVPETFFLSEIKQLPPDLENYVLKPLFSFAGQGVHIDVSKEDIDSIEDAENWILQRKVQYADVIKTPDVPAKAEIRVFYFWEKESPRPVAVNNLARLSKGKMIGVRYNMDKDWVGGSLCYFEK